MNVAPARHDIDRDISGVRSPTMPTMPRMLEPDGSTLAAGALDRCAREDSARHIRLMSLLVFACNLVFWPTDPLVFADPAVIAAFTDGRLMLLAGSGALLLLCHTPVFRRAPVLLAAPITAAICFTLGYMFGWLGGPSTPWLHYTHVCALVPLVAWTRPAIRAGITASIGLAPTAGYFLGHPEYVHDPLAASASAYALFVAGASTLVGVYLDRLRTRNFLLREQLALQAGTLERRVGAQTRELRALASHLETAQEAERTRLARELHDELGQDLTALRYALKLTRLHHESEPARLAGDLEQLGELLGRTTASVRRLLTGLRPRVLDDLGLAAALEWLGERVTAVGGPVCVLAVADVEAGLPADVASAAFRTVQEALTNVARHAGATRVEISAVRHADGLALTVVDDGVGCDPAATGGMGLIGMRERAQALGGQLRLERVTPHGTAVHLWLPLGRAA
jgi:signal transduction histidine kinase